MFDGLTKEIYDIGEEEGIKQGREEGIKEGIHIGMFEGQFSILVRFIKKGMIDVQEASNELGMTESEFRKRLKKYGM